MGITDWTGSRNVCSVTTRFLKKMAGVVAGAGLCCWAVIRSSIPIAMIVIGTQNLAPKDLGPVSEPSELRDPCPNGAADWLYTAGICLLVSSILLPCIIGGVMAGAWPLGIFLVGLVIMEFSILIWGSVVVFGAYKDWTYDVKKYSDNYCEYTPMVFAFVILIMKWVSMGLA